MSKDFYYRMKFNLNGLMGYRIVYSANRCDDIHCLISFFEHKILKKVPFIIYIEQRKILINPYFLISLEWEATTLLDDEEAVNMGIYLGEEG